MITETRVALIPCAVVPFGPYSTHYGRVVVTNLRSIFVPERRENVAATAVAAAVGGVLAQRLAAGREQIHPVDDEKQTLDELAALPGAVSISHSALERVIIRKEWGANMIAFVVIYLGIDGQRNKLKGTLVIPPLRLASDLAAGIKVKETVAAFARESAAAFDRALPPEKASVKEFKV